MSRPRLIALLLALITLAVYLPVVNCGFVNFDDQVYVTENPHVQAGLTWAGLKWAFTTWYGSNWHPLTWLSHMTDCTLFGLNPAAPHFVNALIHAINTALLFVLLWRLTSRRDDDSERQVQSLWPCAFIAALFAWHPLHVESVAWISERKDVLSTFFALLALLGYTRYVQQKSRRCYWVALGCFALGLMAKPMLVTLPFVMLLLDFWPLKRVAFSFAEWRTLLRLIFEKTAFFLLVVPSCLLTYLAQRQGEAVMTLEQLSFSLRSQFALIAYGQYLVNTFWPVRLAIFYPLPNHLHWIHAAAIAATAALVLLSWLAWRARNYWAYITVGWLWFLGTLVPVIGLVKVGSMELADRYTYLPLVGIFIAIAFGARDLTVRWPFLKKVFTGAAVVILLACVALTERQIEFWRNSETLFAHAIAVTGDNPSAHINLGAALETSGQLEPALAEYRMAARLADDSVNAHYNIANVLLKLDRPAEALPEFRKAVELNPAPANLHAGLGVALVELGKFNEASNELVSAIRLDPNLSLPHLELAKMLLQLGRDSDAVDELRAALRIDPDNFEILTYAAQVLSADKNTAVRNGRMALALAIKANDLSGQAQPRALDVLGMACAETGDFTNAQLCAQKALDIATSAKMTNLEELRQRVDLYKNHQPWRESFTNEPAGEVPKNN